MIFHDQMGQYLLRKTCLFSWLPRVRAGETATLLPLNLDALKFFDDVSQYLCFVCAHDRVCARAGETAFIRTSVPVVFVPSQPADISVHFQHDSSGRGVLMD